MSFAELPDDFNASHDESPFAQLRREAVRLGGWRGWLGACAENYVKSEFADHHVQFWQWVQTIRLDVKPDPIAAINIWSRSHAKSTSAELAVAKLCATGQRKYVVYVCKAQAQADQHVATIGTILESEGVRDVYPSVGQRLVNEFGYAKGWRRSQLRSAAGFSVEAYGLDAAQRGAKIDEYRPDLIIFDDVDDPEDSEDVILKKIDVLTKGLLPTGSRSLAVIGVQNLISAHGIFGRIVSGEADFLQDRHLSGPIPAIEDIEYDIAETENGANRYVVTGGRPTWQGYSLADAQADIDTFGLAAWLVEFQHEVGGNSNMFPLDAWQKLDVMPRCRRYVRAWDFAGTEAKKSDWTVGVKMGRVGGRYYIVDVIRTKVASGDLRELLLKTARADGRMCRIVFPRDPGQAGIYQALDIGKGLAGYRIVAEPQTGKKATKWEPLAGQVQLKNVYVPKGAPWLQQFISELKQLPGGGRWDDQCDSASSGFNYLSSKGEGRSGFSGSRK